MFDLEKGQIGKIFEGNILLEHHPTSWLSLAYELKRVEELIYLDFLRDWDLIRIMDKTKAYKPHPATPNKIHYLVIGLALENLLKCLYLNKHPTLIKDGEIKDKLFKSHNLVQIATEKLEFKLSSEEKFVLELGTKSVIWFGRYPIPLKQSDTIAGTHIKRADVHLAFHVLFEKLFSLAKIKSSNQEVPLKPDNHSL